MLIVRRLEDSDSSHMYEIIKSRKLHLGSPVSLETGEITLTRYKNLLNRSSEAYKNNQIFGAFDSNKILVGWASIYKWTNFPWATIQDLTIRQPSHFALTNTVTEALFAKIYNELSADGRHTIFMVTKLKPRILKSIIETGQHLDLRRVSSHLGEFRFNIEEIIPPNSASKYFTYNLLLGEKTFSKPLMIRRGFSNSIFLNSLSGIGLNV